MGQSLNLSVSGEYTSINDLNGLPPGALNEAVNVESRYKNTLEPRRGFEGLAGSSVIGQTIKRMINFLINGVDRTVALKSSGVVEYYNGSGWTTLPGNYSTGISNPNDTNAKSRFIRAGQNLYMTSLDGIRSISSGTGAQTLRAGVPKGLNIEAQTDGSSDGFFDNNVVLDTTGNITSGAATITHLGDTTGIEVDQYVGHSSGAIPVGTKILSITPEATLIIQTGNTTAGSTNLSALVSNSGIVAGVKVSGSGIAEGTTVVSISAGPSPYTVVLSAASFQTATGTSITFTSPIEITMDANATSTLSSTPISFYSGAQVAYRLLFGRVETDNNGGTITRLGAPTPIAIANNIAATAKNVTITATLPKNSSDSIEFVQLYRSEQTDSISITPLDQYQLVYEADLTPSDFTARVITITDSTPDSLKGIPLYAGSDREGILQANNPPPMSWDCCPFRDFMIYVNSTQPTTLKFTIVSVGAPSGIQLNDTITVTGTFAGVSYSRVYTAKSAENQASQEFKFFTAGTPSQNITDTANSLIRVINYDNSLPVHATLISTTTDLPGQILLECDNPSTETFMVTASAHTDAYDPTLNGVESEVNTINNGIYISKSGELEAVPATNLLRAGDSSSGILRCIPLRDYVVVIKSDGIYKLQGLTPSSIVCNPFDLTTRIIGADTAVSLNSAVWMYSNQGVVTISDGGVESKSIPIDDQLNRVAGSYLSYLTDLAFAIGYESDRKYVLSVPTANDTFSVRQHVFNYVTNTWTKWSRNLRCAYINSTDGKLYIARADDSENGFSKERKTGTYQDYVDEAISLTIDSVVSTTVLELSDVNLVNVGDILYQDLDNFSPITEIDSNTNRVTVESALNWVTGSAQVLTAFECFVKWKQVFGDNPAFVRQFPEGLALFKNTRFNTATLNFVTDYSGSSDPVTVQGTGNGLWGLFGWGEVPFGGTVLPSSIRFYIPQNKQMGSFIIPSLTIRQGYSDFKFQGLAISYFNVSQEVGK